MTNTQRYLSETVEVTILDISDNTLSSRAMHRSQLQDYILEIANSSLYEISEIIAIKYK